MHMITSKWFHFIMAKIYYILRYVILHVHVLRHMCNLHTKETEISQKRSKGIKNWKITYSVILSVLSNKTNLILVFSSPLIWSRPKVMFMHFKNEQDQYSYLNTKISVIKLFIQAKRVSILTSLQCWIFMWKNLAKNYIPDILCHPRYILIVCYSGPSIKIEHLEASTLY